MTHGVQKTGTPFPFKRPTPSSPYSTHAQASLFHSFFLKLLWSFSQSSYLHSPLFKYTFWSSTLDQNACIRSTREYQWNFWNPCSWLICRPRWAGADSRAHVNSDVPIDSLERLPLSRERFLVSTQRYSRPVFLHCSWLSLTSYQ